MATCAVALLVTSSGCNYYGNHNSVENFQSGYTIVLPGIDTANFADSNVAQGLQDGGVETAIEVDDWTTGNPLLMLIHLRHIRRNQREARRLAQKIVKYQDAYPDRPVYLVGHSAGGGVALLTLEALPPDRSITAVIFISGSGLSRFRSDIPSVQNRRRYLERSFAIRCAAFDGRHHGGGNG